MPLVVGILFVIGTVILSIWLAPSIQRKRAENHERRRLEQSVGAIGDKAALDFIDIQIDSTDSRIKSINEWAAFRKRSAEWRTRQGRPPDPSDANKDVEGTREIAQLKEKRAELVEKKARLKGLLAERSGETLGDGIGDQEFGRGLFMLIPMGVLGLYVGYIGLSGRLPERNPLALSDAARSYVILATAMFILSVVGFGLFVWVTAMS